MERKSRKTLEKKLDDGLMSVRKYDREGNLWLDKKEERFPAEYQQGYKQKEDKHCMSSGGPGNERVQGVQGRVFTKTKGDGNPLTIKSLRMRQISLPETQSGKQNNAKRTAEETAHLRDPCRKGKYGRK